MMSGAADPVYSSGMDSRFFCRTILVAVLLMRSAFAAPLLLTTGDDYAPYTDQELPHGGMITELVQAVFAQMKQDIRIDWQPWPRAYEEARKGVYAATFPFVRTPEREKDFLYSAPLYETRQVIFARPGSGLSATNLSSLRNKRFCVPKGWAVTPRLEPMIEQGLLTVEHPRVIGGCARMVAADRVDFFVVDALQGAQAIVEAGVAGTSVVAGAEVMQANGLHLIASKTLPGSKELIGRFNSALRVLKASGAYDRIVAAHTK